MLSCEVLEEAEIRMNLLNEINEELRKYAELTESSLPDDMSCITAVRSIWGSLQELVEFTQYLRANSLAKLENAKEAVIKSEQSLYTMQEENSQLQLELTNLREMSKAVSARVGTLRNGSRYSPLLNSIWSLSSRSANVAAICKVSEFVELLIDNLRQAESRNIICSSLGTLANISATPTGLMFLAKKETCIMQELVTIDQKFAEEQIQTLILSLVHNLTADEDMCLAMIRDGLFKYIASHFDTFRDSSTMKQTVDRASQLKYAKTIAFCNQGEIEFLYSRLTGDKYALAKKRLEGILNPDMAQSSTQHRSCVTRIFA